MKLIALLASSVLFLGVSAQAQNGTGILNSAHDFSARAWNTRATVCGVCHQTHDHNRSVFYAFEGLMWNHKLSSATYTMYAGFNLQGVQDAQPTGSAKMCLGCHDGTVAVDAYGSGAGGTEFIGDAARIPGRNWWTGTNGDMRGTHPVSITYDETLDRGLRPKTSAMGTSGTIADVLEGGTKLQCMSCHDVHDSAGEAVPNTPLLRVNTPAAALCLTCHIK